MKSFKKLNVLQMQKVKGGEDNPNIDESKKKTVDEINKTVKFKAGSDLADEVQ